MTRKKLKEIISEDQKYYKSMNSKYLRVIDDHLLYIIKGMKHYRYYQYYDKKGKINKIIKFIHARIMNKSWNKVGIYVGSPKSLGNGITFYHGNIIINGGASLGCGCKLHGNNCIGNKGRNDGNKCPKIGKNVDIGFGAVIIGNLTIADNCVIGANAVVTKSFLEEGSIIVGVPAKKIN